jgi:hypothetical protein
MSEEPSKVPNDTVFQIGEKEYVGAFPIRQDITVIKPDKPEKPEKPMVGWYIYEVNGIELYKLSDYAQKKLSFKEMFSFKGFPRYKNGKLRFHRRVYEEDGIKVGDRVLVTDLFGTYFGTIDEYESGTLYAISDNGNHIVLEFSKDHRKCWVCTAAINPSVYKNCDWGKINV